MTWRFSVPLLVGFYLLFLILTLPAARVVGVLDVPPEQFSYQHVQGTWLVGESQGVRVGTFSLGKVRWRLKPAALLLGCLEYQTNFESSLPQEGRGRFGACIGSRSYVEDFLVSFPARELGILVSNGLLAVGGQIAVDLGSLRSSSDVFKEAQGTVEWKGAMIEGPHRLQLGSVTIDLALQDGTLSGRLSNQGGEVGLTGSVALDRVGRYDLDLRLGPQGSKQAPSWLASLASRQRDGSYLLRHSGQL